MQNKRRQHLTWSRFESMLKMSHFFSASKDSTDIRLSSFNWIRGQLIDHYGQPTRQIEVFAHAFSLATTQSFEKSSKTASKQFFKNTENIFNFADKLLQIPQQIQKNQSYNIALMSKQLKNIKPLRLPKNPQWHIIVLSILFEIQTKKLQTGSQSAPQFIDFLRNHSDTNNFIY